MGSIGERPSHNSPSLHSGTQSEKIEVKDADDSTILTSFTYTSLKPEPQEAGAFLFKIELHDDPPLIYQGRALGNNFSLNTNSPCKLLFPIITREKAIEISTRATLK
jgi:hypothetical protein